jgi:hypothetical protein
MNETAATKLWSQFSDKEKLAYMKANPHAKIPAPKDSVKVPGRSGHMGWGDNDVEHHNDRKGHMGWSDDDVEHH